MTIRIKAFLVHLFTATGAVFALLALLAAVDGKWSMMFLWLVVAFIVDGVDGPLARKYNVQKNAPQINGGLMDLIIDYLTYVFIPAYALFASDLLPGWTGWTAIIVIIYASVIYFADTRMKTRDNSFAGFPACWNMVILVLFAIQPDFWLTLVLVVIIAGAMFTRLKFIHPVRTKRWRAVSLPVALVWTALAGWNAWADFDVSPLADTLLIAASVYLLFAGIAQQMIPERAGKASRAPRA